MNLEFLIDILFTAAGFTGALYMACTKNPLSLWIPLAYFSSSAALQGFSQTIANQCALPANQIATWLAYLHLCFQPFFINALALHFIDQRVARKLDLHVYTFCFAVLIIMLIQGYPFTWSGHCQPGAMMCGEQICAIHGNGHIGWTLAINEVQETIPWYFLASMVVPMLYGSWRFMLLYLVSCPLLAFLITDNMNEWPGVSALLAIPFLLLVAGLSNLRNRMVIKRWLGWHLVGVKS